MALAAIGRLLFKRAKATSAQTIRSGDHSTNVQAGRDINFGAKKERSDVDQD